MDETAVVTVFLRNGAEVLLLRRSDAVGSYPGHWGAVAGHAEGDPDAAARQEIREETGIGPATRATLVRRDEPFAVADDDLDTRWLVHPYLYDCETRTVEPNEETTEYEWTTPTAILRRETVPDLWTSYDRVRPRVATVAEDRDHGSAFLSVRALEIIRDEAALAAEERSDGRDWAGLRAIARDLVAARPSMPVVQTRVDRAMAEAIDDGATPAALESAAAAGVQRALAADDDAAANAAAHLDADRIATLSRSGTVAATLDRASPDAVLVAESRPGGEGIPVAREFATRLGEAVDVTVTTDAALAYQLAARDAGALLVGADAILADGRVVNKVGTRGAALAAAHEAIAVLVVAASDKITPAESAPDLEERPRDELTDDDRLGVANPTFDVTPPDAVDAVVTERGTLDPAAVADVASEHQDLAAWRR